MNYLIYIGIFILIIIKYSNSGLYKEKKIFSIIIFLFLFVICSLKSINYGDIPGYIYHYEQYSLNSYRELWNLYIHGMLKDFVFYVIAKLLNNIGVSVFTWINMIAIVFTGAVAFRIYKDSKNPLLSVVIIIVFYLRFSMTALRQAVALGFTLYSLTFIQERKMFKFIICVLIAAVFHSSSIVFLPAYWVSMIKIGKKQLIILGIGFIISLFMPELLRNIISRITWDKRLAGYSESMNALSWAGYIIQTSILVFCYFFRNKMNKENGKEIEIVDMYLNIMMVGAIFQGFATTIAEVFRLSYFYSIINCIVLPNIIELNSKKNYICIVRIAIFSILLLYMLVGNLYGNIPLIWEI